MNVWAYWQAERAAIASGFVPTKDKPGTLRRDTLDPVDGYWRMMGAKSKHDTPVGVWRQPEALSFVVQIGRQMPSLVTENDDEWLAFISSGFNSCAAVSKADWDVALATGYWPDGKWSRDPLSIDRHELARHLIDAKDPAIFKLLYDKALTAAKAGAPLPGTTYLPPKETT